MAGNLASCALVASITAQLTRTDTGYGTVTRKVVKQLVASTITTYNVVYSSELSIGSGGSTTVDFFASFNDLLGTSNSLTKAAGLLVLPTGSGVVVQPGAANPLAWFLGTFGGSGSPVGTLTVHSGGCLLFYDGSTQTVDATHRNVLFSETGGNPLTLDVVLWGGT